MSTKKWSAHSYNNDQKMAQSLYVLYLRTYTKHIRETLIANIVTKHIKN